MNHKMGTFPRHIFSQTIIISLIILMGYLYAWCENEPGYGKTLLAKTAKAYKELQTYQDETSSIMSMTGPGLESKETTQFSIAIERPNKFALILKLGMSGMTVVSNGKNMWIYMPMVNKYAVEEAPKDFETFVKEKLPEMGIGSQRNLILSLFGENPLTELMEDVKMVEMVGEEIFQGEKTYHLLLYQDEMNFDVWISADDFLIRKVSVDMSKTFAKYKDSVPGISQIKVVIDEIHERIKVGEQIPADTFVFKPPEGTQKTDDLFGSLLGGDDEVSSLIGQPAQNFKLEGLKKGEFISLSGYKNKVVMLDFWATWCGPCREELPILQKIHDKYQPKNVILIAINSGEDRKTAQEFITKEGFTFPVALDRTGKVGELYKVTNFPTLVLIDKAGKIQKVIQGFRPDLKKRLEKELDMLLGENKSYEKPQPGGLEKRWSADEKVTSLDLRGSEVVVVGAGGKICTYNSKGEGLVCLTGNPAVKQVKVANLKGKGLSELIGFKSWGRKVFAFDKDGNTLWEYQGDEGLNDAAISDVDKDGRQEIILGCNNSPGLSLLNPDGTIRWKNSEVSNSWNVGGGDINGDGSIEVVVTSDGGKISTFNAKGKLLNSFDPGFYAAFLNLGKFIAKNKGLEIITSGVEEEKEFVNILDSKGHPIWKFPLGKAVEARPVQTSCCSVRGWLAVGTRDGQIFVFDSKGKVIAYSKDNGKQTLVTWTKNEKGEWLLISGSLETGLNAYSVKEKSR